MFRTEPKGERRVGSGRWRLVAAVALHAFLLGAVGVYGGSGDDGSRKGGSDPSQTKPIWAVSLVGEGEQDKTYDDFIDAVWIKESSIDPTQQSYYDENWGNPVVPSYQKVEYPGRVVRDPATGEPLMEYHLTIEEYFDAIGVGNLYNRFGANDWRKIQSSVINYLGFVGFQFQESDLVDLGYYKYQTKTIDSKTYPSHYVDVPVSHWTHGVTGFLDTDPKEVSEPTWVTDTVHFVDEGFTGKNGISSVADFKDPAKHILIIEDHFTNKYNGIVSGLAARGKTLSDYLGTYVTWDGLTPPVTPPPGGRANKVEITMSGLLAGAHLRGAAGVVELLVDHQNPADENNTYILEYVQDYAGYQTPFQP